MSECTNHRPWDTETPLHKIVAQNRGTKSWHKIVAQNFTRQTLWKAEHDWQHNKHKPSMLQPVFGIHESRYIYARVKPIIDPLLPREQAGFRHGKSTINQVILLTQKIEDSFSAKKKAGVVFVDLAAAYDTVWHHGLTCKLLCLLPDRHMILIIDYRTCS